MKHDELVELTGNLVVFIIAVAMGAMMLYGYTQASPEDKDLIFWYTVTQPQE